MTKKTIAFDLDDVLANNAQGFIDYTNKKYGTSLLVDDYSEHWAELWQVEHEEVLLRAAEFYSSGTVRQYQQIEDAKEVLQRLGKRYRLIIVTSRHRAMMEDTQEWVSSYYGNLFAEIHHAGIWDAGHSLDKSLEMTKADIVLSHKADYLVDDQVKHCIAAAKLGVRCILFGNYKWNQQEDLPKGVTRVLNWQEVGRYFNV